MRTTLTLDDDLAEKLRELAHRRQTTFKQVVNEALRRGLSNPDPSETECRPFRLRSFRSAFRPGVDPERLNQLLDDLDAREQQRPT